MSKYLTS